MSMPSPGYCAYGESLGTPVNFGEVEVHDGTCTWQAAWKLLGLTNPV